MKQTGKFLKEARLKKDLTMDDVVRLTGREIEKTTISRIENGIRKPSLKASYYFSQIYGVTLDEIARKELGKKARIKKIKIEKKKRGRKPKKKK